MGGELAIKPYAERDEAQVVALWLAAFPNPAAHNDPRRSIQRKLALQRELFLVGKIADHVVGTVMAGYDGHRGWIYSVAVSPAHQRNGIGGKLLKHAETALRAMGCPKINLQILCTNAEVVAFYESCGYVVEERISMGKRME